jgi:hypothetical protein
VPNSSVIYFFIDIPPHSRCCGVALDNRTKLLLYRALMWFVSHSALILRIYRRRCSKLSSVRQVSLNSLKGSWPSTA